MSSLGKSSYFRIVLVLLAFAIPLYYQLQSVLIALSIISWIATFQYCGAWDRFKKNSYSVYWILFLGLYAISILYSSNTQEAWSDVLRKSSFVLLPIIISTSNQLDEPTFIQLHRGFVLGCLAAFLLCLSNAFMHYSTMGGNVFFSDQFAGFTHNNAVNLSAKCFYAMLFMLNYKRPFTKLKEAQTFIIILLFLFIILLASKTIILVSIAFLVHYSFPQVQENVERLKRIRIVLFSGLFIFILSFFIKDSPVLKRFNDLTNAFEVSQTENQIFDISSADNLTKRMVLWKAAIENLQENNQWIFGVGAGDLQSVQNKKLSTPNFTYSKYNNFGVLGNINIHNMYLQSWLATGILGLFVLLMLSVFLLYSVIRFRMIFFAQFLFLFCFFMMQESMLQTQSGIVFFCFFHLLFIQRHGIKLKPHKTSDFFS